MKWSDEVLPPMLQNSNFQNADTHRELKERLYYKIISYFEQGKVCYFSATVSFFVAAVFKRNLDFL